LNLRPFGPERWNQSFKNIGFVRVSDVSWWCTYLENGRMRFRYLQEHRLLLSYGEILPVRNKGMNSL